MKRRWQGRRFPGKRGGRRAAPGRRKAPRAASERPPRMIAQIVVCGALAGLIIMEVRQHGVR